MCTFFLLMIRLMIEGGVAITSVSCRTWASREARDPTLLLSCADNSLRLYRYDTCSNTCTCTINCYFAFLFHSFSSLSLPPLPPSLLSRIMSNGDIYLKRKMSVPHTAETIRSAFCPLMSFLQVSPRCHGNNQRLHDRGRVWCRAEKTDTCTCTI